MRNYFGSLFYAGCPVSVPGTCTSAAEKKTVPESLALSINPNPATATATIRFALPHRQTVSVKIYDVAGRYVTTISEKTYEPGWHTLIWSLRAPTGKRSHQGCIS